MTLIDLPDDGPERFQPPMSPAGEGFWAATRERRLELQWCRACERAIHFPREACPTCLGVDLEYRPAAGIGTVYAATVIPVAGNPGMRGREPYVVALVDLPEGVRLLTNVLAVDGDLAFDPTSVVVGAAVTVAWEPLADGRHLPVFTLDPA